MEFESTFNRKYIGYRNTDINQDSKSGNFFSLIQHESLPLKYEIEVDNVYCIPSQDIAKNTKLPSEVLAKHWFKKYNLKEIAKEKNIPYDIFINRIVAKEAAKRGYDAIQYGDALLQGIRLEENIFLLRARFHRKLVEFP